MTIPQSLAAALTHQQAGDFRQAEELYRKVLIVHPANPTALHGLGPAALPAGRHDVALQFIRKAIAVDPTQSEYIIDLGIAFAGNNQLNEAVAAFRRAIE